VGGSLACFDELKSILLLYLWLGNKEIAIGALAIVFTLIVVSVYSSSRDPWLGRRTHFREMDMNARTKQATDVMNGAFCVPVKSDTP